MWIPITKAEPDPALGCVLYRCRKKFKKGWFVGIAYFTVSGKWQPDLLSHERSPWWTLRNEHAMDLQWMEIPHDSLLPERTPKALAYQGLGWMHAELCRRNDNGEDIGQVEISELLDRAARDLDL